MSDIDDKGYVPPFVHSEDTTLLGGHTFKLIDLEKGELMSGQYWYDKFATELCPPIPDGSTKNVHATYSIGDIKEAAKRAAGLDT